MSRSIELFSQCCRVEIPVELSEVTIIAPLGTLSYLLYRCPLCGEESECYLPKSSAELLVYRGVEKVELPTEEELQMISGEGSCVEYLEAKLRGLAVTELPDIEA